MLAGGLGGCFSAPQVRSVTGGGPSTFADLPRAKRFEAAALRAGHSVVAFASTHQALVLRSWNFELDPEDFSEREADRLLGTEAGFLLSLPEASSLSGP